MAAPDFPSAAFARQAIRDRNMLAAIMRAMDTADQQGRTLLCGGFMGRAEPLHAGEPNGCRSDGRNCICHCHDPIPNGEHQ